MRISSLCALLLAELMPMYWIALSTYLPAKSGLLSLSISTDADHALCLECLVKSLGCAKLYLLRAEENLRLYWVEGHSDILSLFLSYCHGKFRCNLHVGQPVYDDIIELKMAITQLSTHPRSYESTETSPFSLVDLKSVGLIPFELSTDWKHNFFKLMLKNEGSIPVFFGLDLTIEQKGENVLERLEEEDLYKHMPNLIGYSSTRCMIIPGPISQAVCRECLSMHSKWFAIRSYILSLLSRKFSAELLVFSSNYDHPI